MNESLANGSTSYNALDGFFNMACTVAYGCHPIVGGRPPLLKAG